MSVQSVVQAPADDLVLNRTQATPAGSVAAAAIVIVPRTRAPAAGLVSELTGPSLSMRRLIWAADARVLPALSVASARKS